MTMLTANGEDDKNHHYLKSMQRFDTFTMVRDDVEANDIGMERIKYQEKLVTMIDKTKHDARIETSSWPQPPPAAAVV